MLIKNTCQGVYCTSVASKKEGRKDFPPSSLMSCYACTKCKWGAMGIGERLGPVEKERLLLLKAGGGSLWVRLTALHPCLVQGTLLDKRALC